MTPRISHPKLVLWCIIITVTIIGSINFIITVTCGYYVPRQMFEFVSFLQRHEESSLSWCSTRPG